MEKDPAPAAHSSVQAALRRGAATRAAHSAAQARPQARPEEKAEASSEPSPEASLEASPRVGLPHKASTTGVAGGSGAPVKTPAKRQRQIPETRAQMLERLSNPLISLHEASVLLCVCSATVRRMADDRDLPHTRTPGGQRRFYLRDVMRLAQERERERRLMGRLSPRRRTRPAARAATPSTQATQAPQRAPGGALQRARDGRELLESTYARAQTAAQTARLVAAQKLNAQPANLPAKSLAKPTNKPDAARATLPASRASSAPPLLRALGAPTRPGAVRGRATGASVGSGASEPGSRDEEALSKGRGSKGGGASGV